MKKLPMRRIVSLPVLAAFVVLGASCSQQVQQPVKKAVPPPVYVGKVEQVYPNPVSYTHLTLPTKLEV